MKLEELDVNNLTAEQILSMKAQYSEGKKHLAYFNDTMKHFKFPEKRMKTNDTVFYERVVPQIETMLKQAGKL